MAQARIEYGRVIAPRPISSPHLDLKRLDIFKYLMICMVLFTIVSIFHVWSRFKLIDLNLQLSEVSRMLKDAEQEQKRLKLEAASMKTPARVEAIAKGELRMALPTDKQVVFVK
jgi:cell division protein FtsL